VAWHKRDLKKITALPEEKLSEALPRMDKAGMQVLLVTDRDRRLVGIITDGDIRRALLRGVNMDVSLTEIMGKNPKTVKTGTDLGVVRKLMLDHDIRHIPLLDDQQRVVDLLLCRDVFGNSKEKRTEKVIIMAGGTGARLDPFTKILPKPMIPLGDKPIVEVIMEKFHGQGFADFTISLGYKADIVRLYFAENNGRKYKIGFVQEKEPLGTAGALGLLNGDFNETFIVSNCDIIVETDYGELLRYHREHGNALTILGALRKFTIPYGVLKVDEDSLQNINEKPNFHFLVNSGVYVLEPEVLGLVSKEKALQMPDLIDLAKEKGLKVGVFPHHGEWFDIGQWEEYRQTLRAFELTG
jgi:dTDP-glucose pyrophosphorylase